MGNYNKNNLYFFVKNNNNNFFKKKIYFLKNLITFKSVVYACYNFLKKLKFK